MASRTFARPQGAGRATRLQFDIKSGKWSPLDLDEPASGVVEPMDLGHGAAAYQVGRLGYVYHSKTSTWDRLDVGADDKQDAHATQGQ
jgi:hypothetical protein